MKNKLLCFAFVLAAMGGSLCAQNSATGNITASSTNCFSVVGSCVWESPLSPNASTTTINIAGTFSATLLVEESNNGGQTWSTAATLSAAGTTTYSTNGFTDIRVRCSAYTSGTAAVTISTGLLQVQSVVSGSGSGSTAPNLNVQYLARNCGNQANCTTVKWDAGTSTLGDATTTSASNIVTCPECKFQTGVVGTLTPPAVAGQFFFATDSTSSVAGVNTCLDNATILFGGVSMTTISSVDSDTQLRVVGNSGTTSSAKACIAWGDDDTTAINAGWAAGGCTTVLSYPTGATLFSAPIWQKNTGCFYNNAGPYIGQRVQGPNFGSSFLIPVPQAFFNFAPVTGGVAGAQVACTTCTAAVGNYLIASYDHVQVIGIGQQATGALANTALFMGGTAARVTNTALVGWLGHGGGATLYCADFLGDEDLFDQSGTSYCGSIGAGVNAHLVTFKANYMVGEGGLIGACLLMIGNTQNGASLYTIDNSTVGCVSIGTAGSSGNLLSVNSYITGNNKGAADSSCVFVGNGSTAIFQGYDQVCQTPVTNEIALNFNSTGATVRASYTTFSANGTGFDILGAAGNTFVDEHGNNFLGGAGRWNGLGRWVSDGSTVQFSAPTISSGFGTSPAILKESGATSFTVNVGTGGVATAGVIGLPAANAGWTCAVYNQTAHAGNRADDTVQTANTTTTVTFQNQTKSTGAAVAWTASDTLNASCRAN